MPGRRACDRCFKYKQKCNFVDDEEACLECELSKSTCTSLRLRVRQGRRPKVKRFGPEGSVQVWEVEGSSKSTVSVTKSYFNTPTSFPQLLSFCYLGAPKFLTVAELALDLRGNGLETYPSSHNAQLTSLASPFQVDSPETLKSFTDTYDLFMLGPSFAWGMRSAFQHSYLCSPLLLHDIIAVLWTTVKRARNNIDAWDQSDVARGAVSLGQLRTAHIANIGDALAILALGQTLAAFDLLTSCNGSTSILRYSLTSISPWYEDVAKNPTLDPVIITSIFWDTLNCLVKREIPILKHVSRDSPIVDRLAGFVTPLLPMFYDLCVASEKFNDMSESITDVLLEDLERVQQEIFWWKPHPPSDLADNFSDQEILKMQAQASMYRTAALLFYHRVLHPIGTLDSVARHHADSIMSDFSMYSQLLKPGTRLQNVGFPILLAAMEIQDLSKDIWSHITLSAAAPIFVSKVCALVDWVWRERCDGSTSYLLDLIARGPDFVVIP
ncbi:hypothetical protein VTL71DRAFT_11923 [Oculimacula yallundae]|uniref:Zn(2)-C6 fungal-type domain-containing protein n=1 Tax=Oculimacula yallundae TaxID=86028 RepID=A0ABR4CRT4_9HELO